MAESNPAWAWRVCGADGQPRSRLFAWRQEADWWMLRHERDGDYASAVPCPPSEWAALKPYTPIRDK